MEIKLSKNNGNYNSYIVSFLRYLENSVAKDNKRKHYYFQCIDTDYEEKVEIKMIKKQIQGITAQQVIKRYKK